MPTRRQNILDQFLSNMGKLYCEAQLLPPLGRSDHQCILFSALNQQRHGKAISRSVRTFKPDNLRSLGLKLNLESWGAVYEASDVDEKVEAFNSIIINSLDTCTPLRHVRLHPSDKEWMTLHIKDQIRARQKAWVKGDKEKYHQKREMPLYLVLSENFMKGRPAISVIRSIRIQASGLNISTRSVVPSSYQKPQLHLTRLNYRK